MDNIDVENELKKNADSLKLKSFSERENAINAKINSDNEDGECKITVSEAVLVTNEGSLVNKINFKTRLWIGLSFLIVIVIAISIILPIVLRNGNETFFDVQQLNEKRVTEEEFYSGIETAHMDTVNLSNFDVSSYRLFYAPDNSEVGGSVETTDEVDGIYILLHFYKTSVILDFDLTLSYNEYKTQNANIKYFTEVEEETYSTKAFTNYKGLQYVVDLISVDDNVLSLFDKLFG